MTLSFFILFLSIFINSFLCLLINLTFTARAFLGTYFHFWQQWFFLLLTWSYCDSTDIRAHTFNLFLRNYFVFPNCGIIIFSFIANYVNTNFLFFLLDKIFRRTLNGIDRKIYYCIILEFFNFILKEDFGRRIFGIFDALKNTISNLVSNSCCPTNELT